MEGECKPVGPVPRVWGHLRESSKLKVTRVLWAKRETELKKEEWEGRLRGYSIGCSGRRSGSVPSTHMGFTTFRDSSSREPTPPSGYCQYCMHIRRDMQAKCR